MKTYYSRITSQIVAAALLVVGSAQAAVSTVVAPITGIIDSVGGFLTPSATIWHSYTKIGTQYVLTANGTTAYSANLVVNGVTRRYVVLRPSTATASSPMLLLLHPSNTTPEAMASLTQVADFVLTQGFWAVMPEAIGGKWKDDPSTSANDDVRFISTLIDTLATQGVDATRVYAGGYSSGGFMSERLACELSDKIAAFGVDAATLHGTLAAACNPARQRSKVYFLGTADTIVPYAGIFSGTVNGLWSATDTLNYWVGKQSCGGVIANPIPDRAADGTTVQQMQYTGCADGTDLQLYTVTGGGHAWPNGLTAVVGVTTKDIDATGLIWNFVKNARR